MQPAGPVCEVDPMRNLFTLSMPFSRFVRNTVLLSLASLLPLLVLYVALRPGFTAMLMDGGPALSRFLRQVATNGFPVVFIVNYISFFHFAALNARQPAPRDTIFVVFIDMPVRIVVFILLHAIIYVVSANWFGSFGGSPATALRVVAPTLARSALFENISGVYLYATLVSALPLYVSALETSQRVSGPLRRLPGKSGAVLAALGLFGLFALALTLLATLIVRIQSG